MINSMTGFGQAQADINGTSYSVEIKTVNNRYLKTIIKLPEILSFIEDDIDKLLRRNLSRGTVNYILRLKDVPADNLFEIDEGILQAFIEKLDNLCRKAGIESKFDTAILLSLPGIVRTASPSKEMSEKFRKETLEVTQAAIDQLKQMRTAEGRFMEEDLKENCQIIESNLVRINARNDTVVNEYVKKLKQRVDFLLSEAKLNLDQATISREVAVFADRSDISEEVARLKSHVQQFAQACQMESQAGRRLDFICQEMLREANTIASKSSDTEITSCVVDMKCRIERIKEQVQNVE
jgi:uncharacterized protein (TIGR00255 family)